MPLLLIFSTTLHTRYAAEVELKDNFSRLHNLSRPGSLLHARATNSNQVTETPAQQRDTNNLLVLKDESCENTNVDHVDGIASKIMEEQVNHNPWVVSAAKAAKWTYNQQFAQRHPELARGMANMISKKTDSKGPAPSLNFTAGTSKTISYGLQEVEDLEHFWNVSQGSSVRRQGKAANARVSHEATLRSTSQDAPSDESSINRLPTQHMSHDGNNRKQ